MRIVFLSDDFPPESFGGAGIVAFAYAKELERQGHEVIVITTTRKGAKETQIEYCGLQVYQLQSSYHERWRAYRSLYNPPVIHQLKKILERVKPDVVHAHNVHFYLSYYSLVLARRYAKAVFLTAHDTMLVSYGKLTQQLNSLPVVSWWQMLREQGLRFNPGRNVIIKWCLRDVSQVFAISEIQARFLAAAGIKNISVIYNGVEVASYANESEVNAFKQKYDLVDKKVVLFGGRISALKGGEKIIKAFQRVAQDVPEARLLVVGTSNDNYTKQLQSLTAHLGIAEKIIFSGWLSREEMKRALLSCDICVTPSIYFDPFNLFNIEAMAAGKPVVGTVFGGTPEIVIDGKTGYLANPNNKEELAGSISRLLKDPHLAVRMGEKGRQRVAEEFNLTIQTKKILDWYHLCVK